MTGKRRSFFALLFSRLIHFDTYHTNEFIDADVEKTPQRAEGFIAESEKAWQQYLALPRDAEEDAMAKAVEQQRKLYINDGLLALSKAVRERNAEQIELLSMKKLQSAFGGFNAASDKLDEEQMRGARENYDSSQKLFRNMMLVSIAGGVVGIVLLVLVLVLASAQLLRAILRPLNQALRHFDAMAAGDLSRAVQVESKDEMGRLLQGLSTMQQQLAATVRSVRDGSSAIASASSEIASGNMDLSRRTEQQAAWKRPRPRWRK
ncbi:HAMP domain-containing protein [Massilia sp. FT127W]|uniref:HAMP domain-containing protein n=1 Tax=Pseudoduganella aquatica TaxID=2660641 RepID=A0A7X4HC69_9BURK|nr:HAMP domain-containing protein [Pseudoduganella aquatica]